MNYEVLFFSPTKLCFSELPDLLAPHAAEVFRMLKDVFLGPLVFFFWPGLVVFCGFLCLFVFFWLVLVLISWTLTRALKVRSAPKTFPSENFPGFFWQVHFAWETFIMFILVFGKMGRMVLKTSQSWILDYDSLVRCRICQYLFKPLANLSIAAIALGSSNGDSRSF